MDLLFIFYRLDDLLALPCKVLESDVLQTGVLHVPVCVLMTEFHELVVSGLELFLLSLCHPRRLDVALGAGLALARYSPLRVW